MANLETLELTISADAQKATQGIGSLVRSLSFLDTAVGKSVSGLKRLNAELKTLKGYGGIKLPSLASAGASAVTRSAKKTPEEIRAWQKSLEHTRTYSNTTGAYGMLSEEESRRLNPQWYQNPAEQARRAQQYLRDNGGTASWAKSGTQTTQTTNAIKEQNTALKETQNAAKGATSALKGTTSETKKLGQATEETKKKSSGFAKAFSRIGRIFSTMMIRTAIRSLIKAFGESWQAAYEFSSKMNGSFAKSVDASRTLLKDTATTLVQTFAPVLQALVPVLYVVAGAIQYLCNAIQSLLRLIGLSSDLMGANTQSINKYTKAAGGAGKANKNLLASWDQLNIIQSQSGGGGGGGSSYKPGSLSGLVSDEIGAILSLIVGEAMMTVGLILACTGHIGLGVGLIAIGAAAVAKTMLTDFNKLPSDIQKTLLTITTIATAASLALGLILACMGHPVLGVGLIALGLANLKLTEKVASGDGVVDEVKRSIARIMLIASVSLMALGLIVAFANPLLGIGMIAAGAAMWYSSKSIAGGTEPFMKIINGLLEEIKDGFWKAVAFIEVVWDSVATWFNDNVWQPIATFATDAWNSMGDWFSGVGKTFSDAWNSVADFFETLFGSSEIDGSIAYYANQAWIAVSKWWDENIATPIKDAWNGVLSFFTDLWGDATQGTGIAGAASMAWNNICDWWETNIVDNIKKAWDGVLNFFVTLWGDSKSGICGIFNGLWNDIKQLWGSILTPIKKAWDGVLKFFTDIFDPIKKVLSDIWGFVKDIFGVDSHKASYDVDINYNAKWNGDFSNPYLPKELQPHFFASGAYDIPKGDLFIANEQGAELVGSMNSRTTVANQGQIIAGISSGVRDANAEQNALLRRQNELLMGILEKSGNISVEPSASWGRFNQRSAEMWSMATGR